MHAELYATLKHVYQICHLLGKSRKKAFDLCLYAKVLRLEKLINILQERKAIGTISWQKRKLHGDRMKWWCLFDVPLVWKEQKQQSIRLEVNLTFWWTLTPFICFNTRQTIFSVLYLWRLNFICLWMSQCLGFIPVSSQVPWSYLVSSPPAGENQEGKNQETHGLRQRVS